MRPGLFHLSFPHAPDAYPAWNRTGLACSATAAGLFTASKIRHEEAGMSFPKEGKFFPSSARKRAVGASDGPPGQGADYVRHITAALHRTLGGTHAAVKTAASWTGANERTVKNWFAGRYGPSGEHLIALARHSDDVLDAILVLSGRAELSASRKIVEARETLVEILALLDNVSGKSCVNEN